MRAVVFTAEEHQYWFREFIRLETAVGGPDPHLATLGKMIEGRSHTERMWRIGCYGAGYNVPTAEVIWNNWPWPSPIGDEAQFTGWIQSHWPAGFGLRRERRAVRTPEKFARCLLSYAHWLAGVYDGRGGARSWDAWWQHLDANLWGMGRYVLLKVAEAQHRFCSTVAQSDIRAAGGRSPREGLSILYPEHKEWLLNGGDRPRNVARVEALANMLKADVEADLSMDVSYFVLQVVLCEYKKTFLGRQYPGRTHDTELRYWRAMQNYWHNDSTMLPARRAVFPHKALGELNGWEGAREDLERTLPDCGYMWSDLTFDYERTEDPCKPVVWGKVERQQRKGKVRLYEILPGQLYQRAAFGDYPMEEIVLALGNVGVTMIVNVSHKGADEDLRDCGLYKYEHVPFADSGKWVERKEEVLAVAQRAASEIRSGGVVLTHCWHGRNRSTFVNALILAELLGISGREALARVRQVRPGGLRDRRSMESFLEGMGHAAAV